MDHRTFSVLLCLVITMICAPHATNAKVSGKTLAEITTGLNAGKAIANFLKDGKFIKSLASVGENLTPFLSAIGPLADFAFAFIAKRESKELTYMKQKFTEVNNKLDMIIAEFDEVKNVIDWNAVQVSYGTYESKIRASKEDLNRAFSLQGRASVDEKNNFIRKYESDFDNSVQKLYDAIVNDDQVIAKNILVAAIEHTKNHKRKVEKFSVGLVQLLTKGIEVTVSYYALRNKTHDHIITEWDRKMKNVKKRLEQVSKQVKDAYIPQMKKDVNVLISKHYKLDNRDMLLKIYNFVKEKYDWRYWFVAVYADIRGYDVHTMYVCGGYFFLHKGGKNTVVASQDKKNSRRFRKEDAKRILKEALGDVNRCSSTTGYPGDEAYDLVSVVRQRTENGCVPYALEMAVQTGNGLWYIAPNGHVAFDSIKKTKLCMHKCDNTIKYVCKYATIRDWWFNMILFG